ncbi:hypothetical protein [Lonepinella sp. BR2919]|uniref:hypothetical protein n=1 Tax=unclassified Lonepinella TaxID=2642006 RepID=UPI003F6DC303
MFDWETEKSQTEIERIWQLLKECNLYLALSIKKQCFELNVRCFHVQANLLAYLGLLACGQRDAWCESAFAVSLDQIQEQLTAISNDLEDL